MNQNSFYLAMVAGMVVIVVALGFNAYANWTAVECTTTYYISQVPLVAEETSATVGRVIHSCFDHDGNLVDSDTFDPRQIDHPRTPPPGG